MPQEQGVEFLQDRDGARASQGPLGNALMVFELIDHQLDFPALVVEQAQLQSRIEHRVQQGRHQAMDFMQRGIGRATAMLAVGRGDVLQPLGGLGAQAVADEAHGQRLAQVRIVEAGQGEQDTAVGQHARGGADQAVAGQTPQHLGSLLDQSMQQGGTVEAAIQEHQHPRADRAQESLGQASLADLAEGGDGVDNGVGAHLDQQHRGIRLRKALALGLEKLA